MIIKKLKIENFRNIKSAEIEPCSLMNIISGENAQGKTNLIEAIWFFTGIKSFRGIKDNEAVKINESRAKINLNFISGGIENEAEIIITEKKTAKLNGKNLKTPSLLAGNFNAVVFNPDDLSIVSGGPNLRRRFLDICIGQIYPKYIDILREYTRAVKQRNNILKDSIKDGSLEFLLDDFEKIIVFEGEKIIEYRKKYIDILKKEATEIYKGISENKEILEIEYLSTVQTNFCEELKKARKEDKFRGVTSIGPHRDDLIFKINSIKSREYSSQGQKRSIALSLKLAEAEIIKKTTGQKPIILLDDVMSELDKKRQNYILNHIKGWQVFLTCCEESNFENLEQGKIFRLKAGEIY